MEICIIIILLFLVLFLSIKLFLVKRELCSAADSLAEENDGHIHINLVDRDLQRTMAMVNRSYEEVLRIKAENRNKEKALRESISMIAHDMRTPLTAIIGYLQLAENAKDLQDMKQDVEISLERAKYLSQLVNDFFEISLIEAGQISVSKDKINLSEMICEELMSESAKIDEKGLIPVFEQADINCFVWADQKLLSRVLQNLISNAIKYSDGKLEFEIEKIEEQSMTLLKIISISKQQINTERIFDRFYMEDSSRTKGGTGLGLYIVKSFVEKMGGRVYALQEGESLTIFLELSNLG